MLRIFWLTLPCLLISLIALGQNQAGTLCASVNEKGELRLKTSDINAIPELCTCTEVKAIWFKKMQVLNLPDCFSQLDSLKSLSFTKSEMPRIPEVVFDVPNLRRLDLTFTPLYILSAEIAGMKALRTLNLSGTFIQTLPDGLDHLESIDMRNIELNRETQKAIRAQYPDIDIYFSSPCKCN